MAEASAEMFAELAEIPNPVEIEPDTRGDIFVNNLFKTKAPGCFTCDINNFDPTVYDLPGRYFYARATVKM